MKQEMRLDNWHFVGFKTKDQLSLWYLAADIFAMPTREDIWGLVINEAISVGLPVVSSNRCIAALEIVHPGINGFVFENEYIEGMNKCIKDLLTSEDLKTKYVVNALLVAH